MFILMISVSMIFIVAIFFSIMFFSAMRVTFDANLACYFTFDEISSVVDSGSNFLIAINTGATLVTGRMNQA